jgi:hypothetical protein
VAIDLDLDADLRSESFEAAHVGEARRVFADERDDQPGPNAAFGEQLRPLD